ncbi:formin-like protein 4 [Papaver somniferum]|uniref:formin-like protein 4 n=1 Tax=Papaver somniferum TaxID=3469 RepID=UPI000E6FC73C|nr:formin-like protein 4 [Papaver somniferum]
MATALFGYVTANPISAKSNNVSPNNARKLSTDPTAQIFILDPYKSQKTAMVIRSLHITREEILDALLEGKMSLDLETLEKLSDIAPTKEEEEQILAFNGNQTKLADAESFIYHLLKSIPSPFARVKAMLFRSKYDSKICYLKMSLQTLELGCNELRTDGVFYKLFEAIATTQGTTTTEFNLNELRNLCNMKNDNECTHQLDAIVEQVIINQGKRSITRQSQALKGRNGTSRKSESSLRQRDDHEYRTLGLPVVEGLCKELSHVKKAAYIDYTAVERTCFSLKAGFVEIRELFIENTNDGNKLEDDGFVKTMIRFLYRAEEDVKIVKKDEKRVKELVKKTREIYFQNQEIIISTASSDGDHQNLLQVFVMVRELIRMVDQICTDIAGNLKKMETDGLRFQRLSSIL